MSGLNNLKNNTQEICGNLKPRYRDPLVKPKNRRHLEAHYRFI